MATRIRLARGGTKKRPYYRIVVADRRSPRDGKFIERIGSYNPLLEEDKSSIDVERAKYWLGVGATPSERVHKLLALHGVLPAAPVSTTPPKAPKNPGKGAKAAAPATEAAPKAPAEAPPAEAAPATEAAPEAPAEAPADGGDGENADSGKSEG